MKFAKYLLHKHFLQDSYKRLLLIFRKLAIQTFNSKQLFSLNQYYWHVIFDYYLRSRNHPLPFHSCVGQLKLRYGSYYTNF